MAYKHDYDKTLTRLTIILSKLNAGDLLSVSELAEEFNVSTRTIQRDLNERLTTFPIEKQGKKWKMQDGFRIEKSTSIEDAVVLDIMGGLIDGASGKFATKAKNLLSKLKNDEYNPIYTKLDLEDISDKLKEVQQLEASIKSYTIISCRYAFEGYTKELALKPLKIVNYEGFWYLVAQDARNDVLKKYYLKNISNIKTTEKNFTSSTKLDTTLDNALSIWFDEKKEPFKVTLLLSKNIAKYFKRKPISNSQTIDALHEDGSMEITIMITHEMEIIPIVKYWMPCMRVLEPSWIREEIAKDLKKYLLH